MNDNAEYYFIQLLVTRNWELLKAENRDLYDIMFKKYKKEYDEAISKHLDVMFANEKFLNIFNQP